MPFRKKKTFLDQAADYVDSVRPHVESALEQTRDAVGDFVDHTARPALKDARDKAGPALADARDKAGPALAEARDRAVAAAGPAVAEAQKRAKPYLEDARERAAEGAEHARAYAETKRAEVTGQPTPKQKKRKSRLKKLVLLGVIGGAAYAVAKLRSGPSDTWQSSYTPPAPTTPSTPAANKPPAPTAVPDPAPEATATSDSEAPTPDPSAPATPSADEDGPTS
ncbi:hypothetical protein GCM10011519_09220 [Marmoricola endophyticus]|uniref:Uncharacterized protein n=1 Tax=Marmoricola endophyticus TaxID=2040280 RepID=A0A917BD75_9ACTN|nr:hypothetical protein [Marmoricola endophyticus]GGF37822.1 hypothetical protein GCM10011519_09220 [Marmoricola endophyticus]